MRIYKNVNAAVADVEKRAKYRAVRYFNEFLRLRCAPDYLASGVLPRGDSAKELSEIMAMYSACRDHCGVDLGDPGVVLLDVGCGVAPRGAALFAMRTAWRCVGVDPRACRDARGVRRCSYEPTEIETYLARDQVREELAAATAVVAINTHGHARLSYLDLIPNPETSCVVMPCCVDLTPPSDFALVHRAADPSVVSPKNEISVWRRI